MTNLTPINAITVEVRTVYGNTLVYPVCQRAQTFAKLAGSKTLTRFALTQIQALGFEIISMADADWRKAA